MAQKFFGEYAFVLNAKKTGIIKLEEINSRIILEDLGWMRDYKVFEVMEAKKDVVFHLKDHLERLTVSMHNASIPASFPIKSAEPSGALLINSLREKSKDLLQINNFPASLLWIYVSGGWTYDGFNPSSPPNLCMLVSRFHRPKWQSDRGLRLRVLVARRKFPIVKNTDYFLAEAIMPQIISERCNCNEILYYDNAADGHGVLETSRANFFIVKGKKISTNDEGILRGITRNIVIDLAQKNGFCVIKKNRLELMDVLIADEAFITSTTRGVWPVALVRFNDHLCKEFPFGGKITMKLRRLFERYRNKYYKEHGIS